MSHAANNAEPAAATGWDATDLGNPARWCDALRLGVDVVLNTPLPMLLLWGQRRITVFNQAYAELAGLRASSVPGGYVPAVLPQPMAIAAAGYQKAIAGEPVCMPAQHLPFPQPGDYDVHFTPMRSGSEIGGVLCALAASAPASAAAATARRALRILVVEDNLDSQYLVCEMLMAFGHEAVGVGHGEGALELVAAHSYDVLFSDVSLPGISGVEMARRALREQPDLQVIFASGYGDAMLRQVEFAHQSLQKPYELEHLQAALARISQQLHCGV